MIGTSAVRNRATILSAVLVCFSFFLTAYSAKNPALGRFGGAVLGDLATPILSATETSRSWTNGIWNRYFALLGVEEENRSLKARVTDLENETEIIEELKRENNRLRNLLDFKEQTEFKGMAAAVIGYDPSGWVRSMIINKGSAAGMQVGFPVTDGAGVVGQIIAVGRLSSRVLLLNDHSSGVDSLIQRSRVRGVLEGSGASVCELKYIERNDDVILGDTVVTSGMDGVFPKGLVLGTITAIKKAGNGLFQSVDVTPRVDFSKLENVFVITAGNEVSEEFGKIHKESGEAQAR